MLKATSDQLEPDLDRARQLVLELMAIPGKSGEEAEVAAYVRRKLREAGIADELIETDDAHERSAAGGQIGNLILKLPGTRRAPRRLLAAHLDTVPLCVGSVPVQQGDLVRSGNPKAALGADNRAGTAVLLAAALQVIERQVPHPPLTFCWFVQEETGLHGSRLVRRARLARPALAFNWDGGAMDKLTIGATGGYRMTIEVHGLASHAGGAPEWGVSAITIASLAIAQLHEEGWLGDVRRGRRRGTSNVGIIRGGDATNVVTDYVLLKAEARSHDPQFREKIAGQIEKAFHRAARQVKNVGGLRGRAVVSGRLDYEAFRLADDEPCVLAAEEAIRSIGRTPQRALSNGGLDANWLTSHGIPTVTLGCGQIGQHTLEERLDLREYLDACRVAVRIAAGS